jgi:predicted SprT family Zn-dependent metalloprotease
MASIEQRLKQAHKRFRKRGKYLFEVMRQVSIQKREIKSLECELSNIRARYMRECQICMEYDIQKRETLFFNRITGMVYRCDKEPEKMSIIA